MSDQPCPYFPYGGGTLEFIFTFEHTDMSFWKESPGPTWWDCMESFNFCTRPKYGLCSKLLHLKPRQKSLSKAFRVVLLTSKHASDMEFFLAEHFSLYTRCRITLSKERIHQGFEKDEWIGVGIYLTDKTMVGCCVSKPLGRLKFPQEIIDQGGLVDYFCVHSNYRKNGIASFLLDELVYQTAKKQRLVHCFLKEGFPLLHSPPLYSSRYIARMRKDPGEAKQYIEKMEIGLHSLVMNYTHADFLPLTKYIANLPWRLSGDSVLYTFTYRGHKVFLCLTDIHHKTSPEGFTIGELSWMLPQTIEVPFSIQRLAVETCINVGKFDLVLMDDKIPHDPKIGWRKDASFSWYLFNYNPGDFFHVKPFWIL